MFDLRLSLAILIGKITAFLATLAGNGATAAPGLIALKIDSRLVAKLATQFHKNIVLTGTNGKTTTSRMLAAVLKEAKVDFIHNRAGSNLLRGIASTLLKSAGLGAKMPQNYWGLWETDEAVFPLICQALKPQIVLLTNLFRDQLDRYGEIDTVAQAWKKALANLPQSSTVILNADDATVASLGKNLAAKVVYFGLVAKNLSGRQPDHASDATVCPYCFDALKYTVCFAGHMGNYACPKCGDIQPKKDFVLNPNDYADLSARLPGTYNLYNLTAAVALASVLKIDEATIIKGLSNFKPAFGRVEKIKVEQKTLNLFLVKNPTGFNEVINTLVKSSLSTPGVENTHISCLIAINDLLADGTDVSWLWDVNFEKLMPHLNSVIVSGIRAYDMALRLKYASPQFSILNSQYSIEPNLKKALNQLLITNNQQLYILPTYTAMLEIRKILNQMGLVHSSWED